MATAIDFSAVRSGIDLSDQRVNELYQRSQETGAAFARRLESLMATYAEARDRYSRDAEALVASASDPETRRAAQQLAKKRLADQVLKFRFTLVQSSEPERADMLRQLKGRADEADQILALLGSPVQHLGRIALGDARRLAIQQTLAEGGPVELEAAARQAIMTGDLPMAAAVVTVVDRRGKDRRPFSAADFARRVVGERFDEQVRLLREVKLAFDNAFAAEREFIRGKPDPLTNVSLALARRQLDETAPVEDADA
jgi:hypothetical protein